MEYWNEQGVIVAGGYSYGNSLNQLRNPDDVYVDDDNNIYNGSW